MPALLAERGKIAPEEHVAGRDSGGKTREPVQQNGGQLIAGSEYPAVDFVVHQLACRLI